MGDERYFADEEGTESQSGAVRNPVPCDDSNRASAVAGYKKLVAILLVATSIILFRAYVLDRIIVSGHSMNNAFQDGNVLWAQKFDVSSFERYDVVVAKAGGQNVIKRVIGLPNETVQIVDGAVYIDGVPLQNDFGEPIQNAGVAAAGYTLKDDEYFLLGDNRNGSTDSRVWGAVPAKNIKGVVVFQVFPFSDFGTENIKRR